MSSEHEATGVRLRLYQSEPHPCPYLANRTATDQYTVTDQIDPFDFQILMDNGFRRSGRIVYRPRCVGCSECIPIRVPVDRFLPSRSQRRAIRRNADVEVDVGRPVSTDENGASTRPTSRISMKPVPAAVGIRSSDFFMNHRP
ncbi:MAG: hypothetical protein IPK83_14705 [Planctomycetes bacterium]|nr:hypothetical protein [Planctomycetota bacterium]